MKKIEQLEKEFQEKAAQALAVNSKIEKLLEECEVASKERREEINLELCKLQEAYEPLAKEWIEAQEAWELAKTQKYVLRKMLSQAKKNLQKLRDQYNEL